jgi:FAD-dependent oxidoreductase family protein
MSIGKISRRKFLGAASGGALGSSLYSGMLNAAEQKPDTVNEPARDIPVAGEFDVLVVGGSCTGVFAAVAAARLGARVGIVEQNGFFGGVATASLVNIWHSPYDTVGERQIIGGLTMETVERLERRNAIGRGDATSSYFRLGTEDLKLVLDELVTGNGIRPFLHASYVTSLKRDERNIEAVIIEDKSGRRALRASCYIDATGDGDLLERSGFAAVRDPENIQPPTTCAILRGLGEVGERHPGFNLGRVVFDPQYPQALKRGFL